MRTCAVLLLFPLGACASNGTQSSGQRTSVNSLAGQTSGATADDIAVLGYADDKTAAAAQSRAGKCPGAADGSELVGMSAKEWKLTDWANSDPLSLGDLRGRVVVVRFWTSGCSYCERTMPVLQKLSEELRGEPVTFIGAFHAKPANSVSDMTEPVMLAKKWGVTFPLALDRDWQTLRSWWIDGTHHRHASSATFVIGKDGRVVHVHPGPVYFPSPDPEDAKPNHDFAEIRDAIRAALAQ